MAQMPKAINYQAVARNAQGQALANLNIKVRLSIVSSASGNPTLYSETRSVTTNALGLFNVQIGGPGALSKTGDFTGIDWVNNSATKSLKVELDINNTGTFTDMGSQSLVTVPYAFAADEAVNTTKIAGNSVAETAPDPNDVLKWDNSKWVPVPPVKTYYIAQELMGITIPASSLAFHFVGTPTEITLTPGQTITTVLSAVLGSSSGTVTPPGISPAFQLVSGGPVTSFYSTSYPSVASISARSLFTVAGTLKVVPSLGDASKGTIDAGTYKIGFAVRSPSSTPLNQNGTLNGFIMVQ